MRTMLATAVAMLLCAALLPITVEAQSLRSDELVIQKPLFPCPGEQRLVSTAARFTTQAESVRESFCATGDASDVDPGANENAAVVRIEARYPLLGMLIGGAAGGVVAAMLMSTADGYGAIRYPIIWVPTGALTGLALGFYIGAKADE